MNKDDIVTQIQNSIEVKNKILSNEEILNKILQAAEILTECYRNGGIVAICGNGGSASDAEHMAGELVGRFLIERRAFPAIALASNMAIVTAVGNDYSFSDIYTRQVEAFADPRNVLFGISTSGNSENIVRALEKAKEEGMKTIALLGRNGGKAGLIADVPIIIPSEMAARIQESHILIIHILCDLLEREFYGKQ